MKVICDSCNKEFILKQEMLQEKYLVCILNAKCRKLQRGIESLRVIINEKHNKENCPISEILEVEELSKELKKEMNRINGR